MEWSRLPSADVPYGAFLSPWGMSPFPAVHSVLSPAALGDWLTTAYATSGQVSVELLRRGVNDIYLVRGLTGHERAILRVSRAGWRTPEELAWELEFIGQVTARGVGAARPVLRRDGTLWSVLDAVEGPRPATVFEFLPGRELGNTAEDAARYGRLAAAAQHVPASHRFPLDLHHLLTEPLRQLRPLLRGFPEQAAALEGLAERTFARLSELAPQLEWGVCHGDLHEGNARVDDAGRVHLFDFDCGGPGYRAYDLAVYWWSRVTHGQPGTEADPLWDAYLTAYTARRPLAEVDRAALPHFVTARSLWFMGLMAGRAAELGTEPLGRPFLDFGVNSMTAWEKRFPTS